MLLLSSELRAPPGPRQLASSAAPFEPLCSSCLLLHLGLLSRALCTRCSRELISLCAALLLPGTLIFIPGLPGTPPSICARTLLSTVRRSCDFRTATGALYRAPFIAFAAMGRVAGIAQGHARAYRSNKRVSCIVARNACFSTPPGNCDGARETMLSSPINVQELQGPCANLSCLYIGV